jgi:hypothetical protein
MEPLVSRRPASFDVGKLFNEPASPAPSLIKNGIGMVKISTSGKANPLRRKNNSILNV